MSKHIKTILAFILPILRQAIVETAADTVNDLAYGTSPFRRRRRRPNYYTPYIGSYDRRVRATQRGTGRSVMFDPDEQAPKSSLPIGTGYHDVTLVAFDISGNSREHVEEFLSDYFPKPGAEHLEANGINIDSWWFAEDDRVEPTDTDSAVFVSKGKQEEARELLREHGLLI